MSTYAFRGLESNGLLLKGAIPRAKAIELAGQDFDFAEASTDHVRCAVLVVQIEKIKTWNIPFIRWTYPEAVWMLELDNGSFLAVKAHTPLYMLGALSFMDKYNTNTGDMSLSKVGNIAKVLVEDSKHQFSVSLSGTTQGDTNLISKLWTRSRGGNYYRIPWGDNKPDSVFRMHCEISNDELGKRVFGSEVKWDNEAIYFLDRLHECAPAFSERPAAMEPLVGAK